MVMAESLGPHGGIPPANDAMSAARATFPQTEEEFKNDVRVSFDRGNNKWVLEDDDGSEWEWNETISKWVPSV